MTTAEQTRPAISKEDTERALAEWNGIVDGCVLADDDGQIQACLDRWRKNTAIPAKPTAWLWPLVSWLRAMQVKNTTRNARLDALERRIEGLENALEAREWKGVWSESTVYGKHNTVTSGGSRWYTMTASIGRKPGQNDDWKLCVKRGADGKDAR